MQVNSVSFKGLWSQPKAVKKIGTYDCIDHYPIHSTKMVYHPFKNETDEQARKAVRELQHTFFSQENKNATLDFQKYDYHYVQAEVGERLCITSDEYEKIAKLTPNAFQSTHEVVYEKYNDTIPKKIQRDLDNHDDVGPYVGFEAVGVAW